MGQQGLQQLADQLLTDPALREQFREDPEAAVKASGVDLSSEELESLRSSEWKDVADAQLTERISKAYHYG